MTAAAAKFMSGPAAMVTLRFQIAFLWYTRSPVPSGTSSSGIMPLILQKPPSGMMPMPYSVSPQVRRRAAGGKPT